MGKQRVESGGKRSCVECKAIKTPMWRYGPAGKNTLCNACGIRYKRLIGDNKRNPQGASKKRKKMKKMIISSSSNKPKTKRRARRGNPNNIAPNLVAASHGVVGGLRSRCTITTVRFVVNNTTTMKKLQCYETKRASLMKEQLAVAALLELAGS